MRYLLEITEHWSCSAESRRTSRHAFTLIELLLVVAIIATLAAIAIPNFLEAQMRSRVARVVTDLRTLAIDIEAYRVDNTAYPLYALIKDPGGAIEDPATSVGSNDFEHLSRVSGLSLTTPVAYITAIPEDPFAKLYAGPEPNVRDYSFKNSRYNVQVWGAAPVEPWMGPGGARLLEDWGEWRLSSAGPDGDRIKDIKANRIYDPTNGTVSDGDLVRSQKRSENRPK